MGGKRKRGSVSRKEGGRGGEGEGLRKEEGGTLAAVS